MTADPFNIFLIAVLVGCVVTIAFAILRQWKLWAASIAAYAILGFVAVVRLSEPDPLGFAILGTVMLLGVAVALLGAGICRAIASKAHQIANPREH